MHQRGACVTLNMCMFQGCLPPSQRVLFGKVFASFLGCVCGFSSAQEKQWEDYVTLSLHCFVSNTIICNLPSPQKSQGGDAD